MFKNTTKRWQKARDLAVEIYKLTNQGQFKAELRTQIDIACSANYISEEVFQDLEEKTVLIGKMLGSLIKARFNTQSL